MKERHSFIRVWMRWGCTDTIETQSSMTPRSVWWSPSCPPSAAVKHTSELSGEGWRQHPGASQVLSGQGEDPDVAAAGDTASISTVCSIDSAAQTVTLCFVATGASAFHLAAHESLAHFKQNTQWDRFLNLVVVSYLMWPDKRRHKTVRYIFLDSFEQIYQCYHGSPSPLDCKAFVLNWMLWFLLVLKDRDDL